MYKQETNDELPIDELNRKGFITTYPSSRYWKGAFTPEITNNNALNLYLHIPYCIKRCSYCFFKITELSDNNKQEIDNYVDYLCQEIAMVSDLYGWSKRTVDTLYFGGGTPSLLRAKHLDKILATLDKYFDLQLTEFVFEVEPITYTKSKAEELSQFDITRISFGVQSFSDEIVKKTGRKDTEKMNIEAIKRALDSGVILNIDLLSGLEGETEATWKHSVHRAIELDVHSITVYKMELYKNSRYFNDIRKDNLILPTDDEEMQFMSYALEQLYKNNYLNSTYFTFTKNGSYPQKHLAQRWMGEDTYGFGVSAFSSLEREYIQNSSNTDKYIEKIKNNELPIERGMQLSSMDLIARDIVLGMKSSKLNCQWIKHKHGVNLLSENNSILQKLIDNNFIIIENDYIQLTEKGVFYGDFAGKLLGRNLLETVN